MDKKALERLRRLAGNEVAVEKPEDRSRKNMYQIMEGLSNLAESEVSSCCGAPVMNVSKGFGRCSSCHEMSSVVDDEEIEESAKPDFADIDGDGNKKEPAKKAAKDKEEVRESEEMVKIKKASSTSQSRMEVPKAELEKWKAKGWEVVKESKTEQAQMREWANSVYKQYDDRGHYQEQPEGETVDLSLRRYLNAKAQPVKIEEDHTVEGMLKEYKTFVSEKYAAYDKNNKVVGLYKDLETAKELKPGHTYKKQTAKDKKNDKKK